MQEETTTARVMHSSTESRAASHRLAVWQTEPCPPWCDDAPHQDNEHPADRLHVGRAPREVPLRLYPAVDYGPEGWAPPPLRIYLEQSVEGGNPAIALVSDDTKPCCLLRLRLDEATELADQLQEMVARATHHER